MQENVFNTKIHMRERERNKERERERNKERKRERNQKKDTQTEMLTKEYTGK